MLFCPQCGQQQLSDAVQFCSRCGLSLVGARDLIARGNLAGVQTTGELSARQKGIRQGVMMMASVALIAPVTVFLLVGMLGFPRQLIPLAAILTVIGGFLRMLYALFFENDASPRRTHYPVNASAQFPLNTYAQPNTLPHTQSNYRPALPLGNVPNATPLPVGSWKRPDTGELTTPPSVTENTTRLLERPAAGEESGERK